MNSYPVTPAMGRVIWTLRTEAKRTRLDVARAMCRYYADHARGRALNVGLAAQHLQSIEQGESIRIALSTRHAIAAALETNWLEIERRAREMDNRSVVERGGVRAVANRPGWIRRFFGWFIDIMTGGTLPHD